MENEQRIYEIGYLLSPLIPEEKLDEEIGSLRKLIEDKKGFILNEGRPKMQRLAYPIKKLESAYLGWIKFAAEPTILFEIKNSFKKLSSSIRFLIREIVKETLAPSSAKKIIKKKKTIIPGIKEEAKFEEIDKKLEELLGQPE